MATNKKDKPEMTNQQIIAAIENDLKWHSKELQPKYKEALRQTIEKLRKLEAYEKIGTPEEFHRNNAIDEFSSKMILMMPGHKQDIEMIANQLTFNYASMNSINQMTKEKAIQVIDQLIEKFGLEKEYEDLEK